MPYVVNWIYLQSVNKYQKIKVTHLILIILTQSFINEEIRILFPGNMMLYIWSSDGSNNSQHGSAYYNQAPNSKVVCSIILFYYYFFIIILLLYWPEVRFY